MTDLEKLLSKSSESLSEKYKATHSGQVAHIRTTPQKIDFYGKEFFGDFIFYKGALRWVTLRPALAADPGYPSAESQQIKFNFCETLLREIFDDEPTLTANGIEWTTDKYVIGCYAINEGKAKYTGGNIAILVKGASNERVL